LSNYKFLTHFPGKTSFDENKFIVQSNELAPSIVGRWQKVNGYLPCRIFKNISYGKLGMTNSKTVYELLENNVLYSEDTSNLLSVYFDTDDTTKRNMFKNSLKLVKEKHTYINRINTILQII
jgi:spore maturation protein CgeB